VNTAVKELGPGFQQDYERALEDSSDPRILLAMQGELVTPECLTAELEPFSRPLKSNSGAEFPALSMK